MFKFLITSILAMISAVGWAQTDSAATGKDKRNLIFSGFADAYFAYDFNKPPHHERPGFLYNHNRHHEFNVNLAFIKVAYATDKVRGNLALMAGTYAQYNLAAEKELLKNIFEANAGVKLALGWWLDAGIFPSHIGLESAVSTDNYTLTRSLAAENSPYYESGVKLTYEAGPQWLITGLVLNGWQNIREPDGNTNKALGTQIQFKPNDKVVINSSTFIGNEKPDSAKQRRYFHDLYVTFQVNPDFKLAALLDTGWEEELATNNYNSWFSPVLLLHYRFTEKLGLGARAEYYHDPNGVIINTNPAQEFKTSGYSLNLDYTPTNNVWLRLEGRHLRSQEAIFTRANQAKATNTAVTTSLAIAF